MHYVIRISILAPPPIKYRRGHSAGHPELLQLDTTLLKMLVSPVQQLVTYNCF